MDEDQRQRIKGLFNAARKLSTSARSAFLDSQCGDDPELRQEVEQILGDLDRAGPFLESPTSPGNVPSTAEGEGPGAVIGRYKLLQRIGEGGFGRVYMAEQTEPVVRRVALKVIKLGMDTRQVITRFEAERQALAMMDHPSIARILDAGATPEGRPYFVMELVRGDPITEYCDRNHLGISERLDLFMQVCRAVQHAHQKGIIHRDIKPSNVLVTIADGRPVPKVIDFGIAKATSARLTEKTLFTEFRQLIGTPQYMSPEQAEASGVDIDTRSDIYSLGVLLYELLTGTTPFDPQRLRSAAFGEIQRIIREEDPPKPSTRLSSMLPYTSAKGKRRRSQATKAARQRHTDPRALTRDLRGDLDWIVMRTLEKDRTRRYETADALALDVQRHLTHEPVHAGPPSRSYLLRKFVRRHKVGVLATAAIALALVLGMIGTSAGMAWALAERAAAIEARSAAIDARHAEAEQREQAERNERLAIEEAERAEREAGRAEAAAERAAAAQAAEKERADELEKVADFQASQLSGIDVPMMGIHLRRNLMDKRRASMEGRGMEEPEIQRYLSELESSLTGVNFTNVALDTLNENIFERALSAIDEQFADQPLLEARLLQTLADSMRELGLLERAMDPQRRALDIRRANLGETHAQTLDSTRSAGHLFRANSRFEDAVLHYKVVLDHNRRSLGIEHRYTIRSMLDIGAVMRLMGRYDEAERHLQEALDIGRRVLGEDHETLSAMNSLGVLFLELGRLDDALVHLYGAMMNYRRFRGDEDPATLTAIHNVGFALLSQGKRVDAEPYLRESVETSQRVFGDEHPNTLNSINTLCALLLEQRRFAEAELLWRQVLDASRRVHGDEHLETLLAINNMGQVLAAQGKYSDAESFSREVMEARRRVLGDEHVHTLTAITNLGTVERALGRLEEAELLGSEAVATAVRVLPEGHPRTAMYLVQFAATLVALGRFTEAEGHALGAHAIFDAALGSSHPRTGGAIRDLADLYDAWHAAEPGRGHDEKAEQWRERLTERLRD